MQRSPSRILIVVTVLLGNLAWSDRASATDNRLVVGESVYIGPEEVVDQVTCVLCSIVVEGVVRDSAVIVFGDLENRGQIDGSAIVIAGKMQLQSNIGGDAIVVAGQILAGPEDVRIGGDLVSIMSTESGIPKEAVDGEVTSVGSQQVGRFLLVGLTVVLILLALLVFGTLLALNVVGYAILGPERVGTMARTLRGNSAMCFLGGLGTCFALAVVGLVVAMILPVLLPMILVFAVVSVVGYCGLTYWIGRNLFGRLPELAATVAAATLVLVLQVVPVVGWLVAIVLWNIAVGAAILSGFGTSPNWLSSFTSGGPGRKVVP